MSGLYGNKFLTETVSLFYDDFIDIYYDSVNESKYLIESMLNESVDLVKVKENIINTIKKLFNGFVKFIAGSIENIVKFISDMYQNINIKDSVYKKLFRDIKFEDLENAKKNGWIGLELKYKLVRPLKLENSRLVHSFNNLKKNYMIINGIGLI